MPNPLKTRELRRLQCQACGRPLVNQRAGRRRKFCGPRCRKRAERGAHFVTPPYPSGVSRNDSNSSIKPSPCEIKKADRASIADVPVYLVGGGSFHWPGARLDRATRARII